MSKSVTKDQLSVLKQLAYSFNPDFEQEVIELAETISISKKFSKSEFLQFHQLLLFLSAYPISKKVHRAANLHLQQLATHIPSFLQNLLQATGIYGTPIICNFSFPLCVYLTKRYPREIFIHSVSADEETQTAFLKSMLPNIEYADIHRPEKDFKKRIAKFNTSGLTDLEWLLYTLGQSGLDMQTTELVYQQLGVFISWKQDKIKDSVSLLSGIDLPLYFHKSSADKHINFKKIINKELSAPYRLTKQQKQHIIDVARLTLVYLYSETEPFTHANVDDVTLFVLDRGISVALFGSAPEKRYLLESYIGYLVFKNNVPVAYGGGWIFGKRCQFGINILESFRGGDSAFIFARLLRVYHRYFGVSRFVVKPYQYGLHNPVAIKTGAFWFYYKFGFRPVDQKLKELADNEMKLKAQNHKHRSSFNTLRRFLRSNVELLLDPNSFPDYDCEVLSQNITRFINEKFKGNRQEAIEVCFKRLIKNIQIDVKMLNEETLVYAKQVSLLFCWKWDDALQKMYRRDIRKFIELKTKRPELSWIKHLQQFRAFWE